MQSANTGSVFRRQPFHAKARNRSASVFRTAARIATAISLAGSLSACAQYVGFDIHSGAVATGLAPTPERLTRNVVREPAQAPRPSPRPTLATGFSPKVAQAVQREPEHPSLSAAADVFSDASAAASEVDEIEFEKAAVDTPFDVMTVPEAARTLEPLSVIAPPYSLLAQSGPVGVDKESVAGIYGTVTDSDTFVVNGIRIERSAAEALGIEVGDVVAIEATETNGMISASSIEEIHALIGPMSTDVPVGAAHQLTVMGVPVMLAAGGKIVDSETRSEIDSYSLSIGDRLAVSGLWQGDAVIADRIERVQDQGPDQISGALRHKQAQSFIGPLALKGPVSAGNAPEQFARASGRYEDGRFIALDLALGVPKALAAPGARLSIEGFLRSGGSAGVLGYRIDGLDLELDSNSTPPLQIAGGRAILIGEAAAGDSSPMFKANRGVALPNAFERRLKILDQIDDGFDPNNSAPLR